MKRATQECTCTVQPPHSNLCGLSWPCLSGILTPASFACASGSVLRYEDFEHGTACFFVSDVPFPFLLVLPPQRLSPCLCALVRVECLEATQSKLGPAVIAGFTRGRGEDEDSRDEVRTHALHLGKVHVVLAWWAFWSWRDPKFPLTVIVSIFWPFRSSLAVPWSCQSCCSFLIFPQFSSFTVGNARNF